MGVGVVQGYNTDVVDTENYDKVKWIIVIMIVENILIAKVVICQKKLLNQGQKYVITMYKENTKCQLFLNISKIEFYTRSFYRLIKSICLQKMCFNGL